MKGFFKDKRTLFLVKTLSFPGNWLQLERACLIKVNNHIYPAWIPLEFFKHVKSGSESGYPYQRNPTVHTDFNNFKISLAIVNVGKVLHTHTPMPK